MDPQSTTRAFQKVLSSFKFIEPTTFSEDFAQKRFLKKFQVPGDSDFDTLSQQCWEEYISNDESLPSLRRIPREWYVARADLHRSLRNLQLGEFSFPKGSEFYTTRGYNSLEARLCSSRWSCTYENFESFSKICYNHRALRVAARRRYSNWYRSKGFDITEKQSNRMLFEHFKDVPGRVGFNIFAWKLERIIDFVYGSRWTSIPKNNDSNRPINIEPFANIITQSQLGSAFRKVLKTEFNSDLNSLASTHRIRISDSSVATIDLKNASDSISMELCNFLLPKRTLKEIVSRRSPFILGYDKCYHVPKKVSSMGNGFTFELMSLILTAICRVLDPDSSVFGDDIIIQKDKAPRLIELLESVGLKVNHDKSFVDGPFRESCGGNFHEKEGYVKSFDFHYPENIHDCVVILNKSLYLSDYPSFKLLYQALLRVVPPALQGGPCHRFKDTSIFELIGQGFNDSDEPPLIPPFFITPKLRGNRVRKDLKCGLRNLCYDPEKFRVIPSFSFTARLRSPTYKHLNSSLYGKYFMYLHAGRRAKDVLHGEGRWSVVWFVNSGTEYFRVSTLMT